MHELISPFLLGMIQALTEFLPVSSSGHLFIASKIMQLNFSLLLLLWLHTATLIAIIIFLKKDIARYLQNKRILLLITLTTATTLIIAKIITGFGILLTNKYLVAVAFLSSGLMLLSAKNCAGPKKAENTGWRNFIILGALQGLAIIPGLSRSGLTISFLLRQGVKREDALKISFLALVPTIIISLIYYYGYLRPQPANTLPFYWLSFFSALIFGIFALKLLNKFIIKHKLYLFGYYCFLMSLVTFLM